MITWLARPLAIVAAIGWIVTIVASLAGFAGAQLPSWLQGAMFLGLFPIWIAAILVMNKITSGVRNQDLWKAAFRGCPTWLRYAIWGSWAYTFLSFFLTIGGQTESAGIGFIGVFYASALGTFVTAATTAEEPNECANGHRVGPFDKFCSQCGAEIKRSNAVKLVS